MLRRVTLSSHVTLVGKINFTRSIKCLPVAMQILVRETRKPWYHFLTTSCAIVGGVFTVAGIMDAIFYGAIKIIKKVNLGKQT